MKTRYLFPLLILFSSCGSLKISTSTTTTEESAPKASIRTIETVESGGNLFQITQANIIGNKMYILLRANEVLGPEDFTLTGSSSISKSLPPIRSIRLDITKIPINKGEGKTSFVEQTLVFDIRELAYKQEAKSQIYLQLGGVKEGMLYTYK